MGLAGGAAIRGVSAVDVLAWWRRGVCLFGWAWHEVPQASSFSLRLLKDYTHLPEDMRGILGCRELARADLLGMEHISQHGFPCGLRHPPYHRPDSTVLQRLPAELADQALQKGLYAGQLSQLR